MTRLRPTKTISVSIDAPPERVYAFASNPENLPQWAAGFFLSLENKDGEWIAETPIGNVAVAFAPDNPFGVLDHIVKLPSGQEFNNPMHVVPNGAGSELLFTLFRTEDMTEEKFTEDAALVEKDLRALKSILENA